VIFYFTVHRLPSGTIQEWLYGTYCLHAPPFTGERLLTRCLLQSKSPQRELVLICRSAMPDKLFQHFEQYSHCMHGLGALNFAKFLQLKKKKKLSYGSSIYLGRFLQRVLAQQHSSGGGIYECSSGAYGLLSLEPLRVPKVLLDGLPRKADSKHLPCVFCPQFGFTPTFWQGCQELSIPPAQQACQAGVNR
jgi:hypothetical protein